MRLFEKELPGAAHRVFLVDGADGDPGDSGEFAANGFEVDAHDVLAARSPRRPERECEGFELRRFVSGGDWAAGVEVSLAVNEGAPGYDRGYVERSFAATRGAVEAGRGQWWGAWSGSRLAAQMGMFHEDGLVRFRDVETHPDFRRRGVCRSLLFRACEEARRDLGSPEFIIVPEDDGVRRIYEAVGFTMRERTVDYCRKPPAAPA
jgi:ribosomal protein S18 acetylase RimI-like enzyme